MLCSPFISEQSLRGILITRNLICIFVALYIYVTLIQQKGLTDETYGFASQFFSENQIAEIIMAVVTINAWNRIALSGHFQPGQAFG